MELWIKVAKLNTPRVDESKLRGSAVPRCSGFLTARAADCLWSWISRKNNVGDSLPNDIYNCFDPNDELALRGIFFRRPVEKLRERTTRKRKMRSTCFFFLSFAVLHASREDLCDVVHDSWPNPICPSTTFYAPSGKTCSTLAFPVTTDGGLSILIVRAKYSIPTAKANGDREFAESRIEGVETSHFWYFFSYLILGQANCEILICILSTDLQKS